MKKLFLILFALPFILLQEAQAIKVDSRNYDQAMELAVKGDFEGALKFFDAAKMEDYSFMSPLNISLEIINKAIDKKIKPEAALHLFRGLNYVNQKNTDSALKEFDQAVNLEPGYVITYNCRGSAYLLKGDVQSAMDDFDRIISIDPSYSRAYLNRAVVFATTSQYQKAIDDLSEALKLNSRYTEAFYNRGMLYIIQGKFDEAISDFTKTLVLHPKYSDAYYARGKAYFSKEQYLEALSDFSQAQELDPNNLTFLFSRAVTLEKTGATEEAVKSYLEFVNKAPLQKEYSSYLKMIELAKTNIARLTQQK